MAFVTSKFRRTGIDPLENRMDRQRRPLRGDAGLIAVSEFRKACVGEAKLPSGLESRSLWMVNPFCELMSPRRQFPGSGE